MLRVLARWSTVLLPLAAAACGRPAEPPRSPPAVASSFCAPWNGPSFVVEAGFTTSFRTDYARTIRFDDAKGTLSLHDSDPYYADPTVPAKVAHVLDRDLTLSAADHEALTKALVAICVTPSELQETCAPDACARMTVKRAGVATTVESNRVVGAVRSRLERFFPELRQDVH